MRDLARRIDAGCDIYLKVSGALINAVAMVMFCVMLAVNGYNIFMRSVFDLGTMWHQEVSIMAAFWIYFGAYALIAKDDGYVSVEFLFERLAAPVRRWLYVLISLLVIAFHGFLLHLIMITFEVVSIYETPILAWPEAVYYVPLAIGTADIIVTECIHIVRNLAFPDRPRPKRLPATAA